LQLLAQTSSDPRPVFLPVASKSPHHPGWIRIVGRPRWRLVVRLGLARRRRLSGHDAARARLGRELDRHGPRCTGWSIPQKSWDGCSESCRPPSASAHC